MRVLRGRRPDNAGDCALGARVLCRPDQHPRVASACRTAQPVRRRGICLWRH